MNNALLTEKTAAPSIAELVNVIGASATRMLCESFGGLSREIGKPAPAIIAAIGLEKALALRNYWGIGRIYIPRRVFSAEARAFEIVRLRGEGLTVQAIAIAIGISERQAYNVLASTRKQPSRQAFPKPPALIKRTERDAEVSHRR